MSELLKPIEVNLKFLLMRLEKVQIIETDYEAIEKLKKIDKRISEIGDLLDEVDAITEF